MRTVIARFSPTKWLSHCHNGLQAALGKGNGIHAKGKKPDSFCEQTIEFLQIFCFKKKDLVWRYDVRPSLL
jgi:hypothetical protein